MPKLNGILMVVLAAAVLTATGLLVLRASTGAEDPAVRAEKFLRRLADADADVRREGEDGLRRMGPEAVGPLRAASRSSDRVLAGRAAKLLQELQPPPAAEPGPASAN
jgi:hypothetical protein